MDAPDLVPRRPELLVDGDYVASLQARVRALAPRRLRVLLVTSGVMKYQEQLVVAFFGRAPLTACDWYRADGPDRGLARAAGGLRRITPAAAAGGSYDRVVGFDCNREAARLGAAHGCPTVLLGKLRQPHDERTRALGARLLGPVRLYETHVSLSAQAALDDAFGPGGWVRAGGIDFPPGIATHYRVPPAAPVEALILGGGDRDYDFLWRHRDALPGRVVVSHADLGGASAPARAALDAMRRSDQFRLVPWLRSPRYLWLLLHARVVVMRVAGSAEGDYASIADAIWYGKPVLVNRVKATAHLGDRVTFYDDAADLATALGALIDDDRRRVEGARIKAAARARHDLFGLLVRLFEEL